MCACEAVLPLEKVLYAFMPAATVRWMGLGITKNVWVKFNLFQVLSFGCFFNFFVKWLLTFIKEDKQKGNTHLRVKSSKNVNML